MSAGHRTESSERSTSGTGRRTCFSPTLAVGFLVVLAVVCGVVFGLSGISTPASGSVLQNETEPPELQSAEKVNQTAVQLHFVDDTGVDTDSINQTDFLLSDGELAGVNVTAVGSNATVILALAGPIDTDELTIGIRPDTVIQDTAGNRINTSGKTISITVTGMDGVSPRLRGTNVDDETGQSALLGYNFNERLRDIHVEITGPVNDTLDINDFRNPSGNEYVATYNPPLDGTYTVILVNATDTAGNTEQIDVVRSITVKRETPRTVIGIDFGASSGLNITFDATRSANNIVNYSWEFGDGETGTGERVTHQFDSGIYTITLEATDENGNTGRDTIELNLTDGLTTAPPALDDANESNQTVVRVDRVGPDPTTDAMVSVRNARGGTPVTIGSPAGGEPLVVSEPIGLDALSVTPVSNTSFSLALSATGPGAVSDVVRPGINPVGGLTVINSISDDALEGVEVTFSVRKDELTSRAVAPADIQLQRATNGSWEPLETAVVGESTDRYRYQATAPGLSRFAVVTAPGSTDDGGDQPRPSFTVTGASLNRSTLPVGETVLVEATITNQGDAVGDFLAGLAVNETVVDTQRLSSLDPGETLTAQFTRQFDAAGAFALSVNGTTAGTLVVEPADNGGTDETGGDNGTNGGEDTGTSGEGGNESQSDGAGDGTDQSTSGQDTSADAFTITNVTVNRTTVSPGEPVRITATVQNDREDAAEFTVGLAINETVVASNPVPVPAGGVTVPTRFVRTFNETGTYIISVNGTQSNTPVTVSSGGSGGLFGFLGFLPLGLFRTVFLFFGAPVAAIYMILKAVAFYLGY